MHFIKNLITFGERQSQQKILLTSSLPGKTINCNTTNNNNDDGGHNDDPNPEREMVCLSWNDKSKTKNMNCGLNKVD